MVRRGRLDSQFSEGQNMQRRGIIKLFAAAAASLWTNHQLPASAFLQAAVHASGARKASVRLLPVSIASVSQDNPLTEPLLPLFPLSLVLFPRTNLLLHIFEERYKEMIQDCLRNQWEFGVLLVQNRSFEKIGCTASISEVINKYPDGRMDILVRGQRRFEILMLDQEKSYLRGKPQFFEDEESEPPGEESRQQAIQLYGRLRELLKSEDRSRKEPPPTFTDHQLSFQLMASCHWTWAGSNVYWNFARSANVGTA